MSSMISVMKRSSMFLHNRKWYKTDKLKSHKVWRSVRIYPFPNSRLTFSNNSYCLKFPPKTTDLIHLLDCPVSPHSSGTFHNLTVNQRSQHPTPGASRPLPAALPPQDEAAGAWRRLRKRRRRRWRRRTRQQGGVDLDLVRSSRAGIITPFADNCYKMQRRVHCLGHYLGTMAAKPSAGDIAIEWNDHYLLRALETSFMGTVQASWNGAEFGAQNWFSSCCITNVCLTHAWFP